MNTHNLKQELFAPTINWTNLCDLIPDLIKLDSTPQDITHHSEGDVGIHTRMCLDELRNNIKWQELSPDDQYSCLLGVLMHDIAKPQKTILEDNGSISSRGHSAAGNTQTRGILWRLGVEPYIREFACRIAHYHQLPFFLAEHKNYEYEFKKLSLTLPLNLLSICAQADASGRRTTPPESRGNTLEAIDLFDLMASDLGIFHSPMQYHSISERGLYLEKEGMIDPTYAWPTANKRGLLIAMCGLPGMGKSTIANAWGLPIIGLDWAREELNTGYGDKKGEGQAKSHAQTELKAKLAQGTSVVYDATNLEKDKRDRLMQTANAYMADCIFVHVETPYDTWVSQNKGRGDRSPSNKTLQSMLNRWGAPLGDEGSGQVFINSGDLVDVYGAMITTTMNIQLARSTHLYKNPLGKPI